MTDLETSTSFDYRRAWAEAARPAFETLPENVRDLYERVCREAESLCQLPDTSMSWPEYNGLREAFEGISADELAWAARVVYFWGHWGPSGQTKRGAGGSWKFAHYADQVLRARLGLPERGDGGRKSAGMARKVIEGTLRICWEDKNQWLWSEAGPATQHALEVFESERRNFHIDKDTAYTELPKLAKAVAELTIPESHRAMYGSSDKFQIEEGKCKSCFKTVPASELVWLEEVGEQVCRTCHTKQPPEEVEMYWRECELCHYRWKATRNASGNHDDACSWDCLEKLKGHGRKTYRVPAV